MMRKACIFETLLCIGGLSPGNAGGCASTVAVMADDAGRVRESGDAVLPACTPRSPNRRTSDT